MKNEELAKLIASLEKLIRSQDKRVFRVEDAVITLNHETGEIKGLLEGIKEVHENTNAWMKRLFAITPPSIIMAWLLNRVLGA